MTQKNKSDDILSGVLLDEQYSLTLVEFCNACNVETQWVIELVEEGVVQTANQQPFAKINDDWRFTGVCLNRARKVKRLQRDLGINLAGAALVLDLIDENERLRTRLSR